MSSVGRLFLVSCLLGFQATAASAQAVDEAIAYLVFGTEDGQKNKAGQVKRKSEGEYDLLDPAGATVGKLSIKEIEKCKFKIVAEPKKFEEKDFNGKRSRYYIYSVIDLRKYSIQGPDKQYDWGKINLLGSSVRCLQAADANDTDISDLRFCEDKLPLPMLGADIDEIKYQKAVQYLTSNFCKARAF